MQGGFVHDCNGVWRVQGSLAISRAIGDLHLKEWIISEPEIRSLPLTSDCEFLIMASDGLWDKVCSVVSLNESESILPRTKVPDNKRIKKFWVSYVYLSHYLRPKVDKFCVDGSGKRTGGSTCGFKRQKLIRVLQKAYRVIM